MLIKLTVKISIHALRVEGDRQRNRFLRVLQ